MAGEKGRLGNLTGFEVCLEFLSAHACDAKVVQAAALCPAVEAHDYGAYVYEGAHDGRVYAVLLTDEAPGG